MLSSILQYGKKAAAVAGFAEDPDVVAERELSLAETADRKQRLQAFFDNERNVQIEIQERNEMSEEDFGNDFYEEVDDIDWSDM